MTTEKLHEILDDENRELTVDELQQVLYELKTDCFKQYCEMFEANNIKESQFYLGEQNAFQIALDLMEHIKKPEQNCGIRANSIEDWLSFCNKKRNEGAKGFADLVIKNICERVNAPMPSESYIVERCIEVIQNTVKEAAEEEK